jgi:hypothetical protein
MVVPSVTGWPAKCRAVAAGFAGIVRDGTWFGRLNKRPIPSGFGCSVNPLGNPAQLTGGGTAPCAAKFA